MTLTRRYRFSASHRLHSTQLSEAENQQTFGKCNNPHGHGHNYVVEVSVEGDVDTSTGRVMAIRDLDELVRWNVLEIYDGKNMNLDVDTFEADTVPTTENVCVDVRRRLESAWPKPGSRYGETSRMPQLAGVKMFETPKNIFNI